MGQKDTTLENSSYPYRVMIVGDPNVQCALLREVLPEPQYRLVAIEDAHAALEALRAQFMDVVLVDQALPGLNGMKVCSEIRQEFEQFRLPIIMITHSVEPEEIASCLAAGACDFIQAPYNPIEMRARIDAAVTRKRLSDSHDSAESMLFTLARMVEAKDGYTGDHCARLSHNAQIFGKALGLSREELLALRRGGVLHDIGKLGVPDRILLKSSTLTEDEWTVMRQHTVIGERLCSELRSMRLTLPIIRSHHEQWNGSGYPDGLAGEAIPLLARIFQIVDIHDALRHERPYKPAFAESMVLQMLESAAASGRCDPYLTREFVKLLQDEAASFTVNTTDDLGGAMFRDIAQTGILEGMGSAVSEAS